MPRGGFCLSLFPQEGKRRGFSRGENPERPKDLSCVFFLTFLFFFAFFSAFCFFCSARLVVRGGAVRAAV